MAFLKRTWRVTRPFSQTLTLETNEWELFWLVAIEWMKINFKLSSIDSTEFLDSLWMFLEIFYAEFISSSFMFGLFFIRLPFLWYLEHYCAQRVRRIKDLILKQHMAHLRGQYNIIRSTHMYNTRALLPEETPVNQKLVQCTPWCVRQLNECLVTRCFI